MEKGRLDLEMGMEDLKEEVNVESLGKAEFAVAAAIVDERLVVRPFFGVCGMGITSRKVGSNLHINRYSK